MKAHQRFFLILVDLIFIWASLLLALLIRFEGEIPPKYLQPNLIPYLALGCFSAGILWLFGLYNRRWRYVSVEEGVHLFNAVTVSFGIFAIPVFATHGSFYPRGVVIIAWLIAFYLLGGTRMLLRFANLGFILRYKARKVLIVGGGDAAEAVIRDLKRDPAQFWPIGILDDELRKSFKIHGVSVLGKRSDLPTVVREWNVRDVVITLPSPSILKEALSSCRGLNVEFKTIPSVQEMMNGRVKLSAVREIRIEDLLGREPIQSNLQSIRDYLSGKRVMVTGAGGSIGSELCRQIRTFKPSELILLGRGENSIYEIALEFAGDKSIRTTPTIADIRDDRAMRKIFEKTKPDVVFHAAAHKHVPFMEKEPIEAVKNNFLATCRLAQMSRECGVKKFIFLSTDKSVQPAGIMGVTKHLSEMYLQYLKEQLMGREGTQFISVRFGNVMGSRGSVVPTFQKQILMGGPVTVTHAEMTRYFMTIPEAVQLVLQAAAIGLGGEVFLLDMGRPVNILDLAHQMIRMAGYEPEKDIKIEVIGARPGEKLYEKLVGDDEKLEATYAKKILRVVTPFKKSKELADAVEKIEWICREDNEAELFAIFHQLIPEYAGPNRAFVENTTP